MGASCCGSYGGTSTAACLPCLTSAVGSWWHDSAVEAECQQAARCAACAFFCDTPCREAYFRSVECFEHLTRDGYNGRPVSKQAATEACDHFTLACWAQHKQEMAAVLRKHAAATGVNVADADSTEAGGAAGQGPLEAGDAADGPTTAGVGSTTRSTAVNATAAAVSGG